MFTFGHTPHTKDIIELVVITFITNIMLLGTNKNSNKIQNGPSPCEHVRHNLHVTLDETPPAFIHLSKPEKGIAFRFELFGFMHNTILFLEC
jgi:hypothetical protein